MSTGRMLATETVQTHLWSLSRQETPSPYTQGRLLELTCALCSAVPNPASHRLLWEAGMG